MPMALRDQTQEGGDVGVFKSQAIEPGRANDIRPGYLPA
jgi:hypothetical protein